MTEALNIDPQTLCSLKKIIRLAKKYSTNKAVMHKTIEIKMGESENNVRIESLGLSIWDDEVISVYEKHSHCLGTISELVKESRWRNKVVTCDGERLHSPGNECEICFAGWALKDSEISGKLLCHVCRGKETRKWNIERGCNAKNKYVDRPCEVCGRKKAVKNTVVGFRCQYCRSVDKRHIRAIRNLGGVPNIHGIPIRRYEVD